MLRMPLRTPPQASRGVEAPGRDKPEMVPDKTDAERIFSEALRLTGAERATHMDQACGENATLRQEVKSLLAAYEHPDNFLNRTLPVPEVEVALEHPGMIVGRYKLLEKMGEGGFGVVYLAEQVEPVQRKVALKIIKPGMDTRQVVARFEAERQALALMDHPNIAKVLDAGATQAGRPYFVMELVRGLPITGYCDQKTLSTTERLQLFLQVRRRRSGHWLGAWLPTSRPMGLRSSRWSTRSLDVSRRCLGPQRRT
jgi:eukaryotic-like serine/threonine-protein kinase